MCKDWLTFWFKLAAHSVVCSLKGESVIFFLFSAWLMDNSLFKEIIYPRWLLFAEKFMWHSRPSILVWIFSFRHPWTTKVVLSLWSYAAVSCLPEFDWSSSELCWGCYAIVRILFPFLHIFNLDWECILLFIFSVSSPLSNCCPIRNKLEYTWRGL